MQSGGGLFVGHISSSAVAFASSNAYVSVVSRLYIHIFFHSLIAVHTYDFSSEDS